MTAFGAAARFAHLVAGLGLVGIFTALLLAGDSDRLTAREWSTRMTRWARGLAGLALAAGVAVLAHQTAVAAGRAAAAIEPAACLRLLSESRFGAVWLVRHTLLLLLLAVVALREQERSRADSTAWRIESWILAAFALGAMAWAGHAAAVEPLGAVALAADALHVVAAAAWFGALLPLAVLLGRASTEHGADARPYAVLAVRRFSTLALSLMLVVAATGFWNAWVDVGSVPALVGTPYGGLLLAKVAVLAVILAFAVFNRRRLIPRLSGPAASVGRPAMAHLSRFIAWEFGLALSIVMLTATLSLTTPARHASPYWPFSTRLSYDAVADLPGLRVRLFIGGQLAVLGLLAVVIGILVAGRRALVVGAGALTVLVGCWVALPPLAVDAYPTTYLRPTVPYHVASITRGMALYATHCAVCHGTGGKGDGPGGAGLPRPPADLTAPHTGQHTAGDLFWWISHGIARSGMPPFGGSVSEDERWDLINYLRALAAGEATRDLTEKVEPERPRLAAPDFTMTVGPAPLLALKDLRGRDMVLVVLFSLPDSRPRLAQLARAYGELDMSGVEVMAIPMADEPQIIRRLGADPPILYPIATENASDIVSTYLLFARPPGESRPAAVPRHVEYLVDRRGYVRARWLLDGGDTGQSGLAGLRNAVALLDREAVAPPPEEHVH
jgi:putative copper resistance protein D